MTRRVRAFTIMTLLYDIQLKGIQHYDTQHIDTLTFRALRIMPLLYDNQL